MHRISISLCLLATVFIPHTALAQPLEDALKGLEGAHPRIEGAKEDLQTAKAAEQEAFSGFLPTLDLSASSGYEEVDRTDLSPAGSKTDENASSYSATLTQNLFQGFRTRAAVDSADTQSGIAGLTLASTRQQVLFEGISAYLEVLRFQELTQLALDNQENLRQQLNLEDERVRRGSGIAVDALQAKSRLQVSRERHTAFMGGLLDAKSRYTQVFGVMPETENMPVPGLPLTLVPATLDEAVSLALSHNPQLTSAKQNIVLAEATRKAAKGGFFPSLDVVGSSSYDEDISGVLGEEVNHSVKLQASWQIFSGFADRARVKQAAHGYESAKETAQYTERKTEEEVKFAWSSLTTSKQRMELLDNAVNIAGEVFDARKRLRDAGSETAINVLDAENELYRARIDAASARYDYYLAVYRLLLAMGLLSVENATS